MDFLLLFEISKLSPANWALNHAKNAWRTLITEVTTISEPSNQLLQQFRTSEPGLHRCKQATTHYLYAGVQFLLAASRRRRLSQITTAMQQSSGRATAGQRQVYIRNINHGTDKDKMI